jgi:hypothetical protein
MGLDVLLCGRSHPRQRCCITIHPDCWLCYIFLPWLIAGSNQLLARGFHYKRLRRFLSYWFESDSNPTGVQIAPLPLPLKCIQISVNKSVLFCLLLAKIVVWNGLRGCTLWIVSLPSRITQLVRYLNQTDYNQLLVEAMDLLLQQQRDFELSWMHFRSWRATFEEPFDPVEDPISVDASSPLSIQNFFSYPNVDAAMNQREYDLGWRVRRMCRSVGKRIDRKMSRIENEARVLSSIWSNSGKQMSTQDVAKATEEDTYWITVISFLSKFNPAMNGMSMLGNERLVKDRLRVVTEPDKVSIDLRWCCTDLVKSTLDLFAMPVFTEFVLNSIGRTSEAPLIMDTGASCCVSPCREDFIELTASKVNITDLSSTNQVAGEGLIEWKVLDTVGRCHTIHIKGYYVPKASVRLLSPQCLLQLDETEQSYIHQTVRHFRVHLVGGTILDASYGRGNLPILQMFVEGKSTVWTRTFGFTAADRKAWIRHLQRVQPQPVVGSKGTPAVAPEAVSCQSGFDS